MKWLAYAQADQERHEAKPVYGFLTPSGVAAEFARRCYERETFPKWIDVVVVQVADDGTETEHLFTVDVEHEPVFRARPQT